MWNYRLVKTIEGGETLIRMQEVYYDRRSRAYGHCDIAIQGETAEDCIKDVAWIMAGIIKPVLTYPEDFKGTAPKSKSTKSKVQGADNAD